MKTDALMELIRYAKALPSGETGNLPELAESEVAAAAITIKTQGERISTLEAENALKED